MIDRQRPFNRIEDLHYIDADTGAIIETVKMQVFYGWNDWDPNVKPRFEVVRQYAVDQDCVSSSAGAEAEAAARRLDEYAHEGSSLDKIVSVLARDLGKFMD